jgi:Fe-Mn family superoxide dismutase
MTLHFIKSLTESTDTREIKQDKLTFGKDELDPVMSKDTLDYHYTGLAAKYVERYNKGEGDAKFNFGGATLHNLFFGNLIPAQAGNKPTGLSKSIIEDAHGSFDKFKQEFIDTGVKHFGSGWVWLCVNDGKFKVQGFLNQSNPYIEKCGHPLLGCDIWEHAYYLKYQNNREKYITNWFKVINWDFISKRYEELK